MRHTASMSQYNLVEDQIMTRHYLSIAIEQKWLTIASEPHEKRYLKFIVFNNNSHQDICNSLLLPIMVSLELTLIIYVLKKKQAPIQNDFPR